MQYYYRIFLWKNGAKQEELTKYVTVPIYQELRMDGTVGTGKITLDAMPTAEYGKPYPPKTKIVMERYTTKDFTDKPKRWDYIVKQDTVEIYQSYPKLCNHAIELYDVTICLMDLHCDNIAWTHELHDVTLNYKTTHEEADTIEQRGMKAEKDMQNSGTEAYDRPLHGVVIPFVYPTATGGIDMRVEYDERRNAIEMNHPQYAGILNLGPASPVRNTGAKYNFKNSYKYEWEELESLKSLQYKLNALEVHTVKFKVPKLYCKWWNGEMWVTLFEMPTKTIIRRVTLENGVADAETEKTVATFEYSPNSVQEADNGQQLRNTKWAYYKNGNNVGIYKFVTGKRKEEKESYILSAGDLEKIQLVELGTGDSLCKFTTDRLTETDLEQDEATNKKGLSYQYYINIIPNPVTKGGMLIYNHSEVEFTQEKNGGIFGKTYNYNTYTEKAVANVTEQEIHIQAYFLCCDTVKGEQNLPFIAKRAKYNAYDLIRKAQLTTEAKIVDIDKGEGLESIQHSIEIDKNWIDRLKSTNIYETIFEEKNLLEIVKQVGCYLHAEPYVHFAEDGTDKLVLTFRELGKTEEKNNASRKITVYNSYALSDFYTQLDSYVQNMFSPNNQVYESICVKTASYGELISNDNAELHTKYGILEILEFDVTYKGETKSIKNHIFERSIYGTLPSDPRVRPSKANSIYFVMGERKIEGLTYVAPSAFNGNHLRAIQNIIRAEFIDKTDPLFKNIQLNGLVFHIKYRTQDSLRMASFNPHLDRYEKVSELDTLPHNTQFFAQEDKIIDSERFAANLWGRLVRMANSTYTCNEYCTPSTEKEVGDLVLINNEMHYVIAIDQELYNEAILQKVRYSKNYNNFSAITGLPSEPRFYEISERSMIRREMQVFDFFALTDKLDGREKNKPRLLKKWQKYIKGILFGEGEIVTPNYIYCKFQADANKKHSSTTEIIAVEEMFPNSYIDANKIDGSFEKSSDHRGVIVPLLQFTARNSLLFECDMEDNFKAGEAIDIAVEVPNAKKGAYTTTQAVQYCDIFGGADLLQVLAFKNEKEWTIEEARRLPFAEEKEGYVPKYEEEKVIFGLPKNLYLGLDKDNREAISFNYQINLIDSIEEDRDSFVFFSTLFGKKQSRLKLNLLNSIAPMFSESIQVDDMTSVAKEVEYTLQERENWIEIYIDKGQEKLKGIDLSKVKSLVWYDEIVEATTGITIKIPYIVKNLATVADAEKLNPLYIISIYGEKQGEKEDAE